MECVSLLAAHGANVRIANNNQHSPAQLARMCGHEQCAVYLDSIVHDLEHTASALVPPVPHESPAAQVQQCLISQGLNGGQMPTDCVMDHHTDMEMDGGGAGDGMNGKAHDLFNGNAHFSNGVMNGHSAIVNGAVTIAQVNGSCDGDITVIPAISQNRVPIAGKKRAREEFEDSDFKRARHGEPVFRNTCNGLPVDCKSNGSAGDDSRFISASAIEHQSVLMLQLGYDSMLADAMTNPHLVGEL